MVWSVTDLGYSLIRHKSYRMIDTECFPDMFVPVKVGPIYPIMLNGSIKPVHVVRYGKSDQILEGTGYRGLTKLNRIRKSLQNYQKLSLPILFQR